MPGYTSLSTFRLKLPACGRGARLSTSRLDDENDIMRMVRGCGRPKYTLGLILICARV